MGLYDDWDAKRGATQGEVEAPQTSVRAGEHTPYGQRALDAELEQLRQATEGTRNATLNEAAFAIFQLVNAGHVAEGAAFDELGAAARSIGLTSTEIGKTIRSARTGAARNPRRDVPDPASARPAYRAEDFLFQAPAANVAPDDGEDAEVNPYDQLYLERPVLVDVPRGEPLIEDVLDRQALFMLVGRDQSYKSFIALDWLLSVATGQSWMGQPSKRARTLLVVGEGAYGLDDRVTAWEKGRYTRVEADHLIVRIAPVNLYRQGADYLELLERVQRERYGLIVFDTLQRMSAGAEQNSAKDAGMVIGALDRIRRASGGAVGVVAHSGKSDVDARGSSAFEDDLDIVWRVQRDEDTQTVRCWLDKRKDGPTERSYQLEPKAIEGTSSLILNPYTPLSMDTRKAPSRHEEVLGVLASPSLSDGASWTRLQEVTGIGSSTLKRALDYLIECQFTSKTESGSRSFYKITSQGTSKLAELRGSPSEQE